MSEIQEACERVTNTEMFTTWKEENKKAYVCSLFKIIGEGETPGWQVDFYNPTNDTISSFIADDDVEMVGKDSKIFKESNVKISKLDVKKVKIGVHEALNKVSLIKNEKYPNEVPTKKIVILQNVKGIMWNLSFMTTSFNILNVKINAESGNVIEESLKSLMSFREN